jgi:hypothetical protein
MLLSCVKDNHNANEIIVVPSIGYYIDQYEIDENPQRHKAGRGHSTSIVSAAGWQRRWKWQVC